MIAESWAILCIVIVMAYFISRKSRPVSALTFLPLLLVPLSYLIGFPVAGWITDLTEVGFDTVRLGILVVGLVISCVLYGTCARLYHSKSSRVCYLVMCPGFSALLCLIYVFSIVKS